MRYPICIMANRKQSSEFLGGGPKFNTVGRDNRTEEPIIPPADRTGYRLRLAAIIVVILLLAALLFYMSDHGLGRTSTPPTRGGRAVSPADNNAGPPSNF